LKLAVEATPVEMDQWRVFLQPHAPLPEDHKLRTLGSHPQRIEDPIAKARAREDIAEALGAPLKPPDSEDVYVGVWQNYFSIGLDAKVAYHVDQARSSSSFVRACFRRGLGKLVYAWQGVRRCCCQHLISRTIGQMRTIPAKSDIEDMEIMSPSLQECEADCARGRLRQLMLVNINAYGGGCDVMPRGITPLPSPSDGVLEVMGVRNAAFSVAMFARLKRPAYLTGTKSLAFRLEEGEYMQLDGEPWRLDVGCDLLVEQHRRVIMLRAPPEGPFWERRFSPDFWEVAKQFAAFF